MLNKKYWEEILKQVQTQQDNAKGAVEQDDILIAGIKKKIADFPDESKEDKMPEELKEILKDA